MRAWHWKERKCNCPNVIFGRSPLTILTQGVVPPGRPRPQFWRGVNNWGHPRCGTNTRSRGPQKTSWRHKTMSTGCQFARAGLSRRANTRENLEKKMKWKVCLFSIHYFIWYASGFLNVGAFLVLMSYAINHDNFLIFSSVSTLSARHKVCYYSRDKKDSRMPIYGVEKKYFPDVYTVLNSPIFSNLWL